MKTTRTLTLLGLTAMAASGLFGLPAAATAQQPPVLSPTVQQSLDSLLAKAVAENDINDARALLDKGAYANTLLSEHKAGGTVLHAAALNGHIDAAPAGQIAYRKGDAAYVAPAAGGPATRLPRKAPGRYRCRPGTAPPSTSSRPGARTRRAPAASSAARPTVKPARCPRRSTKAMSRR